MSRNNIAKTAGEIGLVKSNSVPSNTKIDTSSDIKRSTPKRQSDPSIRTQAYDLEEKLPTKNKLETRSVPSLVSISSVKPQSITPSRNGALANVHLPSQDQVPPGLYSPLLLATKNHGTLPCDQYPKCESPVDTGYYSMMNAYSNLSISGNRSPERRFSLDTDYRIGFVASDCSSEGSLSCGSSDSYSGYNDRSYVSSPDPQLEDALKCQHIHALSRTNSQAFQGYHDPLMRVQSFGHEPEPKHHHKPPPPYMPLPPLHHAVAARSSCPNDYHVSPNSPMSKSGIMGRSLVSTRMESISDSRLYESPPQRQHKMYISQESPRNGDRVNYAVDAYGYRPGYPMSGNPSQPCYDQFAFQSQLENQDPSWRVPYCGIPQELPRFSNTREKIFVNLCNIFPAELVRIVMKRNPHVTDAQQLAAAILMEKSQCGY